MLSLFVADSVIYIDYMIYDMKTIWRKAAKKTQSRVLSETSLKKELLRATSWPFPPLPQIFPTAFFHKSSAVTVVSLVYQDTHLPRSGNVWGWAQPLYIIFHPNYLRGRNGRFACLRVGNSHSRFGWALRCLSASVQPMRRRHCCCPPPPRSLSYPPPPTLTTSQKWLALQRRNEIVFIKELQDWTKIE